ncbi:MAG: hypothetical protein WB676_33960 [Bryobacteraceae bacterium]
MCLSVLQAMKDDLVKGGVSPELLARIKQFKSDLIKSRVTESSASITAEAQESLQTLDQIEMLLQLGLVLEASRLIDEMIDSAKGR